ncbi:hypothetical protein [Stigmatella aurantiaca]|uniref:Lipoprotein n=1 Tax=Stigmatella aurantiaca (strain DW4/3-1) TaxID=378806 RepID=E3FYW0_STIAD|nr:hypothetical protein [Stigmatella aurantiaca]ADO72423.1 uncharacterized protein STAUR_4643 [Stigmatella aurantiaca DW4/3-1]
MRFHAFALLLLAAGCGGSSPASSLAVEIALVDSDLTEVTGSALTCTIPPFTGSSGPTTSAPWALVQLKPSIYPKAICNDGTAASYMIHRNPNSTKWLI